MVTPTPSQPIPCPPPSYDSFEEENYESQSLELRKQMYNYSTWKMYYRITKSSFRNRTEDLVIEKEASERPKKEYVTSRSIELNLASPIAMFEIEL